MYQLDFSKAIINVNKFIDDINALDLSISFISFTKKGNDFSLFFDSTPTQLELDAIFNLINNFIEVDLTSQIKDYVVKKVRPFLEDLTFEIKASNIENGITQLNKTSDFLSFMSTPVVLTGKTRAVSLDTAIQNDSLDVVVQLADYFIANPELYSDLAPFITVEKITYWRGKVVTFLAENSIWK